MQFLTFRGRQDLKLDLEGLFLYTVEDVVM